MKKFIQIILVSFLISGCSFKRPYDKLWFRYYGVVDGILYSLVEHSEGVATYEWGPDPRDTHECHHFRLYRLKYLLNEVNENEWINPTIEKVEDEQGDRLDYDELTYLPENTFLETKYERDPSEWAYTDSSDESLLSSSNGMLTQDDIDEAEKLNFPISGTRRIHKHNDYTILFSTQKSAGRHYTDPKVVYCVETKRQYHFPKNYNPSFDVMFSEQGDCFFIERHDHTKTSVLKWNPSTGESIRWFLSKPNIKQLNKINEFRTRTLTLLGKHPPSQA